MRITKSTMTGWEKVGRKHYRHDLGAEVEYDCNARVWRIRGGQADGAACVSLLVAMYAADGTAAKWERGVGAMP